MAKWMRVLVVGGLMTGAMGAGVAIGGVAQEPEPPKVVVANKPHQPVPVEAVVTMIKRPVVLDEETTVALKEGTVVKLAPPKWEYREVKVPTTPGGQSSVLGALTSAGADGWETTGLMLAGPGYTIIVMKRQR
jgi:hypothetical protein